MQPLLVSDQDSLKQLIDVHHEFPAVMQAELENMWAAKLGLPAFDEPLFKELISLMAQTPVDYTLFFRELSSLPDDLAALKNSFYNEADSAGPAMRSMYATDPEGMDKRWSQWLAQWQSLLNSGSDDTPARSREDIARKMKLANPKYTMREWFVVPAYQHAKQGDYSLVHELQEVMTQPYAEQSEAVEEKYYRRKPLQFFDAGGWSHYSCSS